jgi:hypothetical protein
MPHVAVLGTEFALSVGVELLLALLIQDTMF